MRRVLMSRLMLTAIALLAAAFAIPASASFHLYQIDQIYSDASGTVQFIELSTASPLQNSLNFIPLSTSDGSTTHSYTFTNSLPLGQSTINTKVLIATQGFAALGGVMPDYIVPNGFLFLPGGTINYGNVDLVTYGPLPTDGIHGVNRAGDIVVNLPTNFAGATGSVNVPPPVPAGTFDVDANGQVDPLTDGVLILRYLFGLRGTALGQGALGASAARNTMASVEQYIANLPQPPLAGSLDIDGNGQIETFTDGLLIMRYLLGRRGDDLIQNAIGQNATRTLSTDIETYIAGLIPQ